MSKTALIFPGQGSQYVGMGSWLDHSPESQHVFDRAASAGFDARGVCFEGPEEALKRTSATQPALLTVSAATLALLQAAGVEYDAVAGHSLGEHSALIAAGITDFETALGVVRTRGSLMEAAASGRVGAMSAVLGIDAEPLAAMCAAASDGDEVVSVANYNCPGQIVVTGDAAAVERLGVAASEAGARRVVPLPVSGAFHSPLMEEAARGMADALADAAFKSPAVGFYPNVTASIETDAERIREHLVTQVTHPVRWEETIRAMHAAGITRFVEVGAGRALSGMVRRIVRDAEVLSTDTGEQFEEAVDVLARG
jgi:[acyl-carrier-protein] S-malonyltransferase